MFITYPCIPVFVIYECWYSSDSAFVWIHLNWMWVWPCIIINTWKLKGQLDATDWFLYSKTYCLLNIFRAPLCPSSGAQELYRWLLPVVLGTVKMENVIYKLGSKVIQMNQLAATMIYWSIRSAQHVSGKVLPISTQSATLPPTTTTGYHML